MSNEPARPYKYLIINTNIARAGYYPVSFLSFIAHRELFGGSAISKEDIFEFPFSTSPKRLSLGVGGPSSILVKPLVEARLGCSASFGNVERRGVRAVATLLADLRIVFRTSHDRFFARYHSTDDATAFMSAISQAACKSD